MKKNNVSGFTLVEIMVVVAIIGMLSAIVYASFDDARKQSRDKTRMTSLKEMQLAIELYKSQNGSYPAQGCGINGQYAGPGPAQGPSYAFCDSYITSLKPDFISELPRDPRFENDSNKGFYYRSSGTSYKLMLLDSVESLTVTSFGDEFARCPVTGGGCGAIGTIANTYAVYSAGAENW